MDIFLIITAILLALVGLVGTVLPILPGTILSYVALLLMHWSDKQALYGVGWLIGAAVVGVVVIVADYFLPPIITKRFGGSPNATKGALIGMLSGIFFVPFGMVLGAIVGAFIGEYWFSKKRKEEALRAAWGSFLGFIVGTGMKLLYGVAVLTKIITSLW